jgi:hypothetical protein
MHHTGVPRTKAKGKQATTTAAPEMAAHDVKKSE